MILDFSDPDLTTRYYPIIIELKPLKCTKSIAYVISHITNFLYFLVEIRDFIQKF